MKRSLFLFPILLLASCGGATPEEKGDTPGQSGETCVVYFSRAGENWQVGNIEKGNTKVMAEYIIDKLQVPYLEIEPKVPYPVSYDEMLTVARNEQNSDARPEIKELPASMNDYGTILLGFPIWHGKAPNIILTFLDHYDFSGKTIITFVTHGGSSFGSSTSQLTSYLPKSTVKAGLAINGSQIRDESSRTKVNEWLDGLDL